MSLRSTLRLLEQLAATPMLAPRCAGCGFPSRMSGGVLVLLNGAESLTRCALCGEPLDEQGRALAGVSAQGERRPGVVIEGVEKPT